MESVLWTGRKQYSAGDMFNIKEVNVLGDSHKYVSGMASVVVDKDILVRETMQEDELKQGGLPTLIKGWSNLSSTFNRRDSCEFTTCVSPCVRKATTHLQQLKHRLAVIRVGNASQFHGADYMSRGESPLMVIAESRPLSSGNTNYASDAFSVESSALPSFSPTCVFRNMFIACGMQNSQISSTSPSQVSEFETLSSLEEAGTMRCTEKPHLVAHHMGYDVIEEVIRLLGRMEHNRLTTQEMLVNEQQRVNGLRSQIDELAFERLMELPAAVQKEHESCATDINELNWHCAYQGRLDARLRRKMNHAEFQYSKLIGELESSKESCPLVREKLELEDIAMTSIQSKQDETDEELKQTLKRLEATQKKTNEAKTRASQERKLIKQDVDIIRNLLNEIRY